MGKLRFVALCLAVAACGSDDRNGPADAAIDAKVVLPDAKVFMDAPPPVYDFACKNNPAPAAGDATANITLSGFVQEVYANGTTPGIRDVAGATLNACKAGAPNCTAGNKYAGPVTSGNDGSFSLGPIATSMDPLDGYITMTHTGSRTMRIYPPQPLKADQAMIPALTFDNALLGFLGQVSADYNQDPNKGMLVIQVTDCANTPIDGASIVVKQNDTELTDLTDFDTGTFDPMYAGNHVLFNVPPGATEVNATYNGMALLAHTVEVVAGTTTATIVRPGYF